MKKNKHYKLSRTLRVITAVFLCAIFMCSSLAITASAAPSGNNTGTGIQEVDSMFDSIIQILYGLCRFAGGAALLWGIVQIAMSLSSHDNSQKVQGFFFAGAGVLILFAPNIVQAITA